MVRSDAVLGMDEGRGVCRGVDVATVAATAEAVVVTDDGETVLREECGAKHNHSIIATAGDYTCMC